MSVFGDRSYYIYSREGHDHVSACGFSCNVLSSLMVLFLDMMTSSD